MDSSFAQVEHPEPMLSLASAGNPEEFTEWRLRTARHLGIDEFTMNVEPKIDGLAVRLVYQNGRLVQGVTRGDGASGEDVTHNVRTVRNLPLTLRTTPEGSPPEILEVRGEIYMPRSVFEDANREREEQGEAPYSNPRNAASGILRQLDPELASRRGLMVWIYSNQHPQTNSHRMSLTDLAELGLPVNPLSRVCSNTLDVEAFHRQILSIRGDLDYEIDGIVVKVDDFSLRGTLGANNREPRWATAWKFPPGQNATMLKEIRISHGRFGRLTPVAVLEPVELGGVTVGSASLHNEEDVHRKDIRAETMVIVERAGDVIPQVTGPADPIANGKAAAFQMPSRCPACGTRVEIRPSEVGHWCPNQDCPALLPEQLKSFVGKRGHGHRRAGRTLVPGAGGPGNGRKHRGPLLPDQENSFSSWTGWERNWRTGFSGTSKPARANPWKGPSTAWESSGWAGRYPRSWRPGARRWTRSAKWTRRNYRASRA